MLWHTFNDISKLLSPKFKNQNYNFFFYILIVCETRNIEKEIIEDRPKCEFVTKEINLNNGKVIKLPTKVSFKKINLLVITMMLYRYINFFLYRFVQMKKSKD